MLGEAAPPGAFQTYAMPPVADPLRHCSIRVVTAPADVGLWDWTCENGAQTHQRRDG